MLGALEDASWRPGQCPARLLEPLLELEAGLAVPAAPAWRWAWTTAAPEFASELEQLIRAGHGRQHPVYVSLVEADDDVLLRRFSECGGPISSPEGVGQGRSGARQLLEPGGRMASAIIDAGDLTLSQLRQHIANLLPDLRWAAPPCA